MSGGPHPHTAQNPFLKEFQKQATLDKHVFIKPTSGDTGVVGGPCHRLRSPRPERVEKLKRACQRDSPLKMSSNAVCRAPLHTISNQKEVASSLGMINKRTKLSKTYTRHRNLRSVVKKKKNDGNKPLVIGEREEECDCGTLCMCTIVKASYSTPPPATTNAGGVLSPSSSTPLPAFALLQPLQKKYVDKHTARMRELLSPRKCTNEIVAKICQATPPPTLKGWDKNVVDKEMCAIEKYKRSREKHISQTVEDIWTRNEILRYGCTKLLESFHIKLYSFQKLALASIFNRRRIILAHDMMMGKALVCLAAAKCIASVLKIQVFVAVPNTRMNDVIRQSRLFNIEFWAPNGPASERILIVHQDNLGAVTHESFTNYPFGLIVIDMHEFVQNPKAWPDILGLSGSTFCNFFVGSTAAPLHMQHACKTKETPLLRSEKAATEVLAEMILPYLHAIRAPNTGEMKEIAATGRFYPHPYTGSTPSQQDIKLFQERFAEKYPQFGYNWKEEQMREFAGVESFLYISKSHLTAYSIPNRHRVVRYTNASSFREEKYNVVLACIKTNWATIGHQGRISMLKRLERANSHGKVRAAIELIKKARNRRHSVLVLSNHRTIVDRIYSAMKNWGWNFQGTSVLRGNTTLEDTKCVHSLALESKCVLTEYNNFWHASFNYRATGTGVVLMIDRPNFVQDIKSVEDSAPLSKKTTSVWLKGMKLDELTDQILCDFMDDDMNDYTETPWYHDAGLLNDDSVETGKLSYLFRDTPWSSSPSPPVEEGFSKT